MSLSWARLEPEPGEFDATAFDRYREILACARGLGLRTMVTLHHFALPRWVARAGGFGNRRIAQWLERFAGEAARRLKDHVSLWATINEPSVLAFMGYAGTRWPPGDGKIQSFVIAMRNLLSAHAAAYRAVHAAAPGAEVGIVLNAPAFDPARPERRRDRWVTALQDWAMTGVVLDALGHGRFSFPLAVRTEPAPEIAGSFDFLGLNYYGRYKVRFNVRRAPELFGRHVQRPTVHTEHVDWGEIHPEGLTRGLVRFSGLGRPVYVTENGVFDPTDEVRQRYLVAHVRAVHAAISRGVDVRGYFHWSLVDNFEWAEGYSTPFGLIGVDRATGERTPRKSAELYARICRANGLT